MYDFDLKINIHPCLTNKSIYLSTMLSQEQYFNTIGINNEELKIFKEILEIRNYLHLPLDHPQNLAINSYEGDGIYNFFANYFNERLVNQANILRSTLGNINEEMIPFEISHFG